MSLRRRLTLTLIVGGGVLLGVLFAALDDYIDGELYSRFDAALVARGRALAEVLGARADGANTQTTQWPEFAAARHEDFFQLWDTDGSASVRSRSSRGRDLPKPEGPTGTEPLLYDIRLPDGHRGRAVALHVWPSTRAPSRATPRLLVVATEREAIDKLETQLHAGLTIGVVMTLSLVVALSVLVVRQSLRPLARFSAAAVERIKNPAMTGMAPASLPAELAPIATTLNQAFERLFDALSRERRFARDVAHELRTPLAELQLLAQSLAGRQLTGQARTELDAMQQSVAGMTRVVDGLLVLARCEAGIDTPALEPVNLAQVVRQQVALLKPSADTRQIAIQVTGPGEQWILSDAAMIERIVANLLGNAVQHAPRGATVEITFVDAPLVATLRVSNPAPRLAANEVARLGERHFQGARSDAEERHAGLGLALAQALARQLGATLAFALNDATLSAELRGLKSLHAT